MKKFKNNHKPKRKYTKRSSVQSTLSLNKPLALGFPSLVLIITFLMTAIILAHPTENSRISFQMPTISFDFFKQLTNVTSTLDPRQSLVTMGNGFIIRIQQLGIFFMALIAGIIFIFSLVSQGIAFIVTGSLHAMIILIHGISVIASALWGSIIATSVIFTNIFVQITQIVVIKIMSVMFLMRLCVITILHAIGAGIHTIVSWIEWPFKMIGASLKANQPFFDAVAASFRKAFEVITAGTQGLSDLKTGLTAGSK